MRCEVLIKNKLNQWAGGTLATIYLLVDEIMGSIGSSKPKKQSKIDPFMALPDGSKSVRCLRSL